MMRYLTYDENGKITGSYLQELREEHKAAFIEVDEGHAARRFEFIVVGGKLVAAPLGTYDPPAEVENG